jgi:hypothetical protein
MTAAGSRSKTLATWLALAGGTLGLHRFYLHGARDLFAWAHAPVALLGTYGVSRMLDLGQDDRLAWLLIPLLGLAITAGMLAAIVYGLTPDERWASRHGKLARPSGWLAIFGVIAALFIGATVLISTIAFSSQRYFESQVEPTHSAAERWRRASDVAPASATNQGQPSAPPPSSAATGVAGAGVGVLTTATTPSKATVRVKLLDAPTSRRVIVILAVDAAVSGAA